MNPKYPIYIISKGRWESRLTSKALEKMKVPYKIVIEEQELEQYSNVIDSEKILVLPFSNLGSGSVPARNWVWWHSITTGHERHWILDDNIMAFCRLNRNSKIRVDSGTMFRCAEDFTDRYTNVSLSGFNYRFFAAQRSQQPAFRKNRRIYSCILIKNHIKYRWRGRYNEDTDLSIRILSDGHCTILFQAFLCDKIATMTMKGGNTDELYKEDGRLKMAESLAKQHPFHASVVTRYNRDHHHVNYDLFKKNKLIKKEGVEHSIGVDNYGMILIDKETGKVVEVE